MKPALPQTISRDVQCIKAATWNRLLECVAWAMDHPRGDGHTIQSDGAGNLRAAAGRRGIRGGDDDDESSGPFWTRIDEEKGQLVLENGDDEDDFTAGVIRCGIHNFIIHQQRFKLKAGTLYVYVRYDKKKYAFGATLAAALPETPGRRTWTARIATVRQTGGAYELTRIHHGSDLDVLGRWT